MIVAYTRKPPTKDMIMAGSPMMVLWARIIGNAIPLKTKNPVKKRPKSTTVLQYLS